MSSSAEGVNIKNSYNHRVALDDNEDDFETETDSQGKSKKVVSIRKPSTPDDDQDIISTPPVIVPVEVEVEKGQRELERPGKERSPLGELWDNDDSEADAYNFTEDQKRAMMELMAQKQEDTDLLDEEPPEYNVKGRLEQLNAELANDPTPVEGDREIRVGFKPQIVDLVAPPPADYSDDESQPSSARGEPQPSAPTATASSTTTTAATIITTTTTTTHSNSGSNLKDSENKETADDPNKKQFVVERDGHFSVLSAKELSPSERALYISEDKSLKKAEKQRDNQKTKEKSGPGKVSSGDTSNSSISSTAAPRPPAKPRPNTALTGPPRRNVRPAHSPRPKSAGQPNPGVLDNFSYNSPYAMTAEEKELSKKQAERNEAGRKKRENKKLQEEEKRRKYNDGAFQAWLQHKKEDDKKRLELREGTQSSAQERKEENDQAYKAWLKEKRGQGKKEKLLKKRQQQEKMEGYFLRPREESENAFKEWLRKKNAEVKKQQAVERLKNKMYRMQVKRYRKTQALIKALQDSPAFQYVDYYGYRY